MVDIPEQSELLRRQLLERIETLIEQKDFDELRHVLAAARSSDVAEVVEVLDEIARQILFDLLDPDEAGEVLEKIDEATRHEIFEDLSTPELGHIVATLPPDEAADVLGDLSAERTEKVLEQMPPDESAPIEKLLVYPEDSAGGLMNPELVKVNLKASIGDAIEQVRRADPETDFYHVFVVDNKGLYKGVLDVQTLVRRVPNTPVAAALQDDLPTVGVLTDQEDIANLFRKNDLVSAPVVDDRGALMGRITVDDVLDVMEEEAEEDAFVGAGTHPSELETTSLLHAAAVRLPWLLTCMGGAMFSAVFLVSVFKKAQAFTDPQWLSIFMFMPAIAAMGGNSGLQTSTIVVRGLATGDLVALNIFQVFLRESRIAIIVALACGILAGLASGLYLSLHPGDLPLAQGKVLGLAIGIAMFCGIMLSTTLGLLLPFFFRKVGIDPAISSGPLVTTANDALGILTYFSLALLLLRLLDATPPTL